MKTECSGDIYSLEVVNKRLAYDRTGFGEIISPAQCDVCGAPNSTVYMVDTSDDEYGVVGVCFGCLSDAFIQHGLESQKLMEAHEVHR
jgi:hypothetical protein